MKIHPVWYICICVRLFILKFVHDSKYKNLLSLLLIVMGSGFIYNGYFGSNNEIQISKVFWHETRYVHGVLYILAGLYNYNRSKKITSLILILDLVFSIMYRISHNK